MLLKKIEKLWVLLIQKMLDDGTIRKVHAVSLEKNSVHGSDSLENAVIEIAHFFNDQEIHP